MIMKFDSNPDIADDVPLVHSYDMQEFEYVPEIVERFKKSKVQSFISQTYEEFIEYDIYCSRFGKPFTGKKKFIFSERTGGDNNGIENYLNLTTVRDNIQALIDAKMEPYGMKTVDEVIVDVYGSKEGLKKIVEVANKINRLRVQNGNSWGYRLPKDSKSND